MSLKSDKLLSMVLAFACSFIFLLALGVWQLERLAWKNNLLQQTKDYGQFRTKLLESVSNLNLGQSSN